MIYGLMSQKGGAGKTTLAVNLAAHLALGGARVLLVDADPQGSALAWSAARERDPLFPVVGMAKPTVHRELPELARDYDAVVIDGAPRVNELARSAILAADLVVIPVQPSPYDVWAAAETVALVREASVFKETLKAVVAINRRIVNTAIGRDVAEALAPLGLPVLAATITQRVVFAESAAAGLAVAEAAPDSAGAHEIAALVRELQEHTA